MYVCILPPLLGRPVGVLLAGLLGGPDNNQ